MKLQTATAKVLRELTGIVEKSTTHQASGFENSITHRIVRVLKSLAQSLNPSHKF
jgi:hypothetical protein